MSDYKPQTEILKLCAALSLHEVAHIMVVDEDGSYTIQAGVKKSDPDLMLLLTLLRVYFRNQDNIELFAELSQIIMKYGNQSEVGEMAEAMVGNLSSPARKEDIN